jgi:hypothetical protein
MPTIYSGAARVVAWIGREKIAPDSKTDEDTATAVSLINYCSSNPEILQPERFCHLINRVIPPFRIRPFTSLLKLCQRTYWSRLWILQEMVLGFEIVIQCGIHEISWERLSLLLTAIYVNWETLFGPNKRWYEIHPLLKELSTQGPYLINIFQQKFNQNRDGYNTIGNLTTKFRESACQDSRDKIFGILSLSYNCCRQAVCVDYGMSLIQVIVLVLEHQVEHEPSGQHRCLIYLRGLLKVVGRPARQ